MNRTVVTFLNQGSKKTFLMLDDTPGDIAGAGHGSAVDFAALPEGTLIERGMGLLELLQADAGVKQGLAVLLANAPEADPAPLYFRLRATNADAVCWEQLYAAPPGFLALDRRWPIGRIARTQRQLEPRTFDPPLRVVAVLSAAGRDGRNQLDALVAARDASPLPVNLLVISGDDRVAQRAAQCGVTFLQIDPSGLLRQIIAARPQVLHVLCHGGGFFGGEGRLAFAHAADFDAAQLDPEHFGSIFVPVKDLREALRACNAWLVVLAACETAATAGSGEGLTLAHDLACGGIPAVIGMRRLVDILATDAFTRSFYPEVFDIVQKTVAAAAAVPTRIQSIDWAQALTGPRRALSNPNPELVDAWTDPVLYAQYDELDIFVPPPAVSPEARAKIIGKIDQLKGGLAVAFASGAQPAVLSELQQLIADLEAQLTAQPGP